jgi:photosystem II stability/assembly factor-like uncharacterized protein
MKIFISVYIFVFSLLNVCYSQSGWVQVYSGSTSPLDRVLSVIFVNQFTGYAAGGVSNSSGYILKTTNGGQSWNTVFTASVAFQNLSFIDETTGYAVGGYYPTSLIYKTTNSGQTWSEQFSGTQYCYFESHFINVNTGIVVGDWGNIRKTTNGGNTWFGCNSATPSYLESVNFVNQNTGFAAGRVGQIVKTTDGGNNWNLLIQDGIWLNSIRFLNENTGYAVGHSGRFLKTTNSGTSWQNFSLGILYNLHHISILNPDIMFIAGDSGNVLKTTNSGISWTHQNLNASKILYGIYFYNALTGFVYGEYASIYKTQTGGETLPLPALISPPNNSNNIPLTPALVWSNISGVSNYLVQVSPLSNFSIITDSATVTINQRIIPSGKLQANTTYFWRVRATNIIGTGPWTDVWSFGTTSVGINQISTSVPSAFKVYDAYPNPFNPSTRIKFDVPKSSSVRILIYDMTGRQVDNLFEGNVSAGTFETVWKADKFNSGIYLIKFVANDFSMAKKLMLVK